jgi:transcriptional regulator with XRE-family HTH domain
MEIKRLVGLNIRKLRMARGLSQEVLAAEMDTETEWDQAYVSRIEAGRLNLSLETIEMVAKALKVPVAALFEPQTSSPKKK